MTSKTQRILELALQGYQTGEIAGRMGCETSYVRAIKSRLRRDGRLPADEFPTAPQPDIEADMVSTISDLQARLSREQSKARSLEKAVKEAEQGRLSDEEVLAQVFGLARAYEPHESFLDRWMYRSTSQTGVPMTVWSDWHIGETVKPEEVNGVNEFNMEVAERRARTLVIKTVELCMHHMTQPDYPGIVVCLGGDMVTGEIHDELTTTNDEHLLPVVLKTASWIEAGLIDLASKFGKVFVPCVSGNHGRNTTRIQNKSFVYKNFDWLIYQIVRERLAAKGFLYDEVDYPAAPIAMSIPPSNEVLFSVYGHRFLLVHGHDIGVRGGDGIIGALGPIKRGAIKVGAQQAAMGRDFDTLIMGHWHQDIVIDGIHVNNTLKGYDEFAGKSLRAKPTPPSQILWFQSPKYGRTAYWPIFVDQPKAKASGKWCQLFK